MCPVISPDFSDVIEQLPEGNYKMRIVDAEVKDSQKGGKYVRWQMTAFDAADTRCNGKAVWYNTPISGPGAFRFKALYAAAAKTKLEGDFDTATLFGKEILATVVDGVDRNTGEKTGYNEVKAVRAL